MLHPNDLIVTQHQDEMRREAQQQRLARTAQTSNNAYLNVASPTLWETLRQQILRRPAVPKLNTRHAR